MDKSEQILEMMAKFATEMQEGFKEVKSEFKDVRIEINGMKSDIKGIKSDIEGMKSDIKGTKSDIKDIKMTLENEINKNIKIIAEGHRDLNNKLDGALKIENEKELLLIRLTILENEVSRIKSRLEEIA